MGVKARASMVNQSFFMLLISYRIILGIWSFRSLSTLANEFYLFQAFRPKNENAKQKFLNKNTNFKTLKHWNKKNEILVEKTFYCYYYYINFLSIFKWFFKASQIKHEYLQISYDKSRNDMSYLMHDLLYDVLN